jgi:lysophospholipase L1-like esterase
VRSGARGAEGSPQGAIPSPRGAKRLVFWLITLLGPPALLLLGLETALRLASPDRAPLARETLEERLRDSQATEVRVVTTGNLRGLIQPSAYRDLIYELKPSRRWVFQGAKVATNSHGLRGRPCAVDKPPGTFRVAGLGDSVMFGWGVDQEATYMSRLEERLSRPRHRVEALNFAVPGYNSAQEAAVLTRKVLPFAPDLLLLNYCSNDWAAPFFVVDPNLDSIIESSLLLRNIRERIVPGVDESFFDTLQGMGKVRDALHQIGDVARREGIPVLFFVYPNPLRSREREVAEHLAAVSGFVYVDLFGPFSEHLRERGLPGMEALNVAPGDAHPNPEAHELIARVLGERIETLLPWPDPAPSPR